MVTCAAMPSWRQSRAAREKCYAGATVGYSAAAMARVGPYERDTRAMSETLKIDERWIGVMILAPAVLDAYRYFHPTADWAVWGSRTVKVGMAVLVIEKSVSSQ